LALVDRDGTALGAPRDPEQLAAELRTLVGRPGDLAGSLVGDVDYNRDGYFLVRRAGREPLRVKVYFGELPPGVEAIAGPGRFWYRNVEVHQVWLSERLTDRLAVGAAFHDQIGALVAHEERLDSPLRTVRGGRLSGVDAAHLQRRWYLADRAADPTDPMAQEAARRTWRVDEELGTAPGQDGSPQRRQELERALAARRRQTVDAALPPVQPDPARAAVEPETGRPGTSRVHEPPPAARPKPYLDDVLVAPVAAHDGVVDVDAVHGALVAGAVAHPGVRYHDGYVEFGADGVAVRPVVVRDAGAARATATPALATSATASGSPASIPPATRDRKSTRLNSSHR